MSVTDCQTVLCIVMLSVLAAGNTAQSSCNPLPYKVYWNVAEENPPTLNLSKFTIFTANYTQTGSGCSNSQCIPWSQGLFPTISDTGEIVNGGVPQNGSLSAHLERLEQGVTGWIPDPDWDGNAVIDFEAWRPVWELNYGSGDTHSFRYVNYSLYLEKLKHPDWNELQILIKAKKNFESSATNFFVETLNTVKKMRPKAMWGFYGLPQNFFEPCEFCPGMDVKCGFDSILGDLYRKFSDQQKSIWEASTALYPSIYFTPFHSAKENAAYVRSVVNETVRCADGKIPIYPFHWNYYNNGTLLSLEDLKSGLLGPYDVGAGGVVIWGTSSELKSETFVKFVEENVGPIAAKFIGDMCQCSYQHCSGHGRCMPSSSTNCQCYPGYGGQQCQDTK